MQASMPIRCWRRESGSSLRGATLTRAGTSSSQWPAMCSPFTDRTRSAADSRHRPPLDAGRRAASGGWGVVTTRAEAGVMEQEDLGGQLLESILSRRAPFSLEASWFELFDALRQLGFWRPAAAAETVRIEGSGGGLVPA